MLKIIGKTEENWFKYLYENNDLLAKNTTEIVQLDKENYKKRWYEIKFGVEYSKSNISSIYTSYLSILSWYVLLYINGLYTENTKNIYKASWIAYYPYYYSPLASDIEMVDVKKYYTFYKSSPISGSLQHLLIFSKNTLRKLDKKYYNIALKYPQFYPDLDNILVDYELSEGKEYKSIIILPFIQINKLKYELEKIGI